MTVTTRRRAMQQALAVTIFLTQAAVAAGVTPTAPVDAPARTHEVQRGDTLTGIADRYGVTVSAIVAANRLAHEDVVIRIGQRLVIPPPPGRNAAPAPAAPPRIARPRPPLNLVLGVPDFGDRLPLFIWPAEGHVSSPFGRRRSGWHHGVDIKTDLRAPVMAAAGGVVVASGMQPLYGRVVKIEHVNGFLTVYAHNARNLVVVGDRIVAGQTIALVGRTGRATSHHLHFEIRHLGLAYNPLYFLPLPSRTAIDDDDPEEHRGPHE